MGESRCRRKVKVEVMTPYLSKEYIGNKVKMYEDKVMTEVVKL